MYITAIGRVKGVFKKLTFFLVLLLLCSAAFSQKLVFPPELKWWIEEAQKANPAVSVEKFKQSGKSSSDLLNEKMTTAPLYPVFMRWNFSATRFAYFNTGTSLVAGTDGRYALIHDIDSSFFILDKERTLIFQESFGSTSGIDAVNWLRDGLAVAVGSEINSQTNMVTLVISSYEIQASQVVTTKYSFPNAFTNDARLKLKLAWYDQRDDYFKSN